MKINGDLLINTKVDGTIYANSIKSKNLFDINGLVNVKVNDGSVGTKNTVKGNVLTAGTNNYVEYICGQIIREAYGKTITFSAKIVSIGEGVGAMIRIYEGGTQKADASSSTVGDILSITYTCNSSSPIFAFGTKGDASHQGVGAQFTDIQVEVNDTRTDYTDYERTNNNPYVLWTNPDTTVEFPSTTIILSDAISNYKYYEIIYKTSTQTSRYASSGKIPSNFLTEIRTTFTTFQRRVISYLSGTSMTISGCMLTTAYGSGNETTNNTHMIPYQVLGYK